ncbi:MAG: hypothetical protein RL186_836 [Pseudomonadota bacterium]|jgi:outer membrane protein OmpA-like peptidoglycan-associated protein
MDTRKACWPWLLLGLLALGLLSWLMTFTGRGSAKNMIESTRALAQDRLDAAGFVFARADIDGAILKLSGNAPSQRMAEAACKTATDALKGRIGMPGVFARLDCAGLTYPEQDTKPLAVTGAPLNQPNAAALKAEADTCQLRLTDAGKSGVVQFARSKGEILVGQDVLDRVAEVAKHCEKFKIEIGGHTDTGGAASLNQRLSEQRAQTVRQYLVTKGVSAAQLTAKGYGESKPLVNDFPNGNADKIGQPDSPLRAQNRRIEFLITALQ